MELAVGVLPEIELRPCEPGRRLEVARELVVRKRIDDRFRFQTIGFSPPGRTHHRVRER